MIAIDDLEFRYPRGDFRLTVKRLRVAAGERVAIIGPSGSGKTTLLNLIAGIATPDSGRIVVGSQEVSSMSDRQRRDFRVSQTGFVFQRFELIDYLSVRQNILLPFRINRSTTRDARTLARLEMLSAKMGIERHLEKRPASLSQGEQQRVAMCRALILSPPLILADEPTGNLDPVNTRILLDLMLGNATDKKPEVEPEAANNQPDTRTMLVVTHDANVASRMDRTIDFADFVNFGTESASTGNRSAALEMPQ